jgi:RNA polymerase sigma factor (sigma-70 family)
MARFAETQTISATAAEFKPQPDGRLIRACENGDSGAWEELVLRYERLVYSIPLRYGLSSEDASDIVQLTFTLLFQRLGEIEEDNCLGAWLATVAKRHSWRLLAQRSRERSDRLEDPCASMSPTVMSSKRTIERSELLAWIEQGLDCLDQRCRELLIALYFEPKIGSYAEAADYLGLPVGSIGPMRSRCLERLRESLMEETEEITREAASISRVTARPGSIVDQSSIGGGNGNEASKLRKPGNPRPGWRENKRQ